MVILKKEPKCEGDKRSQNCKNIKRFSVVCLCGFPYMDFDKLQFRFGNDGKVIFSSYIEFFSVTIFPIVFLKFFSFPENFVLLDPIVHIQNVSC